LEVGAYLSLYVVKFNIGINVEKAKPVVRRGQKIMGLLYKEDRQIANRIYLF
jgi:hypothetical protein